MLTPDNTEHPFAVWELTGTAHAAHKAANEALWRALSKSLSLDERRIAWDAFLPLFAAFVEARAVLCRECLKSPAYDYHYAGCDRSNRAAAEGRPFANVERMEAWEAAGRPASVLNPAKAGE